MSVATERYTPHDAAVAEPNTNPLKPAAGHKDSASPLHTSSQPSIPAMNNNYFNPWAQPFTPNHGYAAQSYGQDRNRNRNRNCTQWQTPSHGNVSQAPVASAPWNLQHGQQPQYYPSGQQTYDNAAAQQAQTQAYYHQWAQYYANAQPFTQFNVPQQGFGQVSQPSYPFFAPSFQALQPQAGLQGVSNHDLQYAFDTLYKGIKARTRRTNISHRTPTPLSENEFIQLATDGPANIKEYDFLRRVDSSARINKFCREPIVHPTTKPSGRSKEPKIMLPAPKPTDTYIAQATEEPSTVELSGRILVILDLNGTLLYRPNRNRKTMIARPFLVPFLRYLFSNFAVMVWSSARPENVASLVAQSLEEDLRKALVAQWGRDAFNLRPEHYSANVQVYKNLDLVWSKDEIQRQHPNYEAGGRFGQHNTVLIDDSTLKAAAQPYNLLQISEFSATSQQMREDKLREVAGYLEALRTQQDVSRFMRREPFKTDGGKWAYEWPEKDAAAQDTAFPDGQLQDKVSLQSPSKKKLKKNKKAKKREAAERAAKAHENSAAEPAVVSDESDSDGEFGKNNGGVKLS